MGMKGWWLMLVMIIISLNTFGQTTAEDYYLKSEELIKKGKNAEAIKMVDKAIELDPDKINYQFSKGFYLYNYDRPASKEHIKKTLAKYNTDIMAYEWASNYYTLTKDFYKALDVWDDAVATLTNLHDTTKMQMYNSRGYARFNLQDYEGAMLDYKTAYALDTNNVTTWFYLAGSYDDLNKPDSSILFYNKIIAKETKKLTYYNNLGFLYIKLKRYDDAVNLFTKAFKIIEDDKKNVDNTKSIIGLLYSNMGYSLYAKKDYKNALKNLDKSVLNYPSNSYVYKNRALVYIALKQPDKACDDLNHAIALGFADQYGTEVDDLLKKYCQ